MRQQALEIASATWAADSFEYGVIKEKIPSQGLFCAVATAQREPLSHTIIRALHRGAELFWSVAERNKQAIARDLVDLYDEITDGKTVNSRKILKLVQEVAVSASTGVMIIIDELGKNLEFAVQNQGAEDLYLLQQLAELPKNSNSKIYIVGLLHQAFADYGQRLASVQSNEWAKIQGRFEDISFQDNPAQMMRLIGEAIDQTQAEVWKFPIHKQAEEWFETLPSNIIADITKKVLAAAYPLHPIAQCCRCYVLVMPKMIDRYSPFLPALNLILLRFL